MLHQKVLSTSNICCQRRLHKHHPRPALTDGVKGYVIANSENVTRLFRHRRMLPLLLYFHIRLLSLLMMIVLALRFVLAIAILTRGTHSVLVKNCISCYWFNLGVPGTCCSQTTWNPATKATCNKGESRSSQDCWDCLGCPARWDDPRHCTGHETTQGCCACV